jgi:hypothetical protein
MEFVVKAKKGSLKFENEAGGWDLYPYRYPRQFEHIDLQEKLAVVKDNDLKQIYGIYSEFLQKLGLPKDATDKLDVDTLIEFVGHLLAPKKA